MKYGAYIGLTVLEMQYNLIRKLFCDLFYDVVNITLCFIKRDVV